MTVFFPKEHSVHQPRQKPTLTGWKEALDAATSNRRASAITHE
jgi:hypothetical protein